MYLCIEHTYTGIQVYSYTISNIIITLFLLWDYSTTYTLTHTWKLIRNLKHIESLKFVYHMHVHMHSAHIIVHVLCTSYTFCFNFKHVHFNNSKNFKIIVFTNAY